jgi:beta-galactosidase GanA
MEPVEGKFDFTLIDRTIDVARREQLHVVFLWFGAWKNSMSCYAPGWFKQDTKRFPRAMTAEGKQMEIASCFSDNVLQADLKAFSALMRHIREKDPQRAVVIMMQVTTILVLTLMLLRCFCLPMSLLLKSSMTVS